MRLGPASFSQTVAGLLLLAVFAGGASGCVSKSKAQTQARLAYLAGQHDAITRMQQQHAEGGSVTFNGPFNNPTVPWTEGLTLAKAIVTAGYNSTTDPLTIVIRRGGEEIQIDPARLLHGEDYPLQSGDTVQFYLPAR
jgi:hypothetical protein